MAKRKKDAKGPIDVTVEVISNGVVEVAPDAENVVRVQFKQPVTINGTFHDVKSIDTISKELADSLHRVVRVLS